MNINENIKRLRHEHDMTLEELGKIAGVSKQTIQRYESGQISNIPYDKIVTLAHAFAIEPSELMGWRSSADHESINPDAAQLAAFLKEHPEHRRLFDAVQKVSADDVDFVYKMLLRVTE